MILDTENANERRWWCYKVLPCPWIVTPYPGTLSIWGRGPLAAWGGAGQSSSSTSESAVLPGIETFTLASDRLPAAIKCYHIIHVEKIIWKYNVGSEPFGNLNLSYNAWKAILKTLVNEHGRYLRSRTCIEWDSHWNASAWYSYTFLPSLLVKWFRGHLCMTM